MKNLFLAFFLICFFNCCSQDSKPEAKQVIEKWYAKHTKSYNLEIKGEDVKVKTSDFHTPEIKKEHKLIRIYWKGMKIEMAFKKALSEFEWTEATLKENIFYFSLTDIYSEIELNGWKVHPRTPISALHNGEGITFSEVEGNKITMEIDWEIYTVFGYAQNSFCQEQLEIADSSMPYECYIDVRKTLPIKILVDVEIK